MWHLSKVYILANTFRKYAVFVFFCQLTLWSVISHTDEQKGKKKQLHNVYSKSLHSHDWGRCMLSCLCSVGEGQGGGSGKWLKGGQKRKSRGKERRGGGCDGEWLSKWCFQNDSISKAEAERENERAWLSKCSCLENDTALPGVSMSA